MSLQSDIIDELRERAQVAEAEVATLRGAIAAQDARDLAACERVGIPPQGCHTSDELTDELLGLKAELAELLPLWPQRDHGIRCKAPYDQRQECTCPAYDANLAREKALKLVGIKEAQNG